MSIFSNIFRKKNQDDQIIELLQSIDNRLKALEGCITTSRRGYGIGTYFVTGHWNDK